MRKSQFAVLPRPIVDVLFAGDSITEGGMWAERFPTVSTANRGVAGDRSAELIEPLDTLGTGRLVFIMIGTNDLAWGTPPQTIAENLGRILRFITAESPGTRIYVQSVLPRNSALHERIVELNRRYDSVAQEAGAVYLDLFPHFATPQGTLRQDLTDDGVHLNGHGYSVWARELQAIVSTVFSR